jgi:hypothetical protein
VCGNRRPKRDFGPLSPRTTFWCLVSWSAQRDLPHDIRPRSPPGPIEPAERSGEAWRWQSADCNDPAHHPAVKPRPILYLRDFYDRLGGGPLPYGLEFRHDTFLHRRTWHSAACSLWRALPSGVLAHTDFPRKQLENGVVERGKTCGLATPKVQSRSPGLSGDFPISRLP